VRRLIPGGSASRGGVVQVNDRIVEVNGCLVLEKDVGMFVRALAHTPGPEILIGFLRPPDIAKVYNVRLAHDPKSIVIAKRPDAASPRKGAVSPSRRSGSPSKDVAGRLQSPLSGRSLSEALGALDELTDALSMVSELIGQPRQLGDGNWRTAEGLSPITRKLQAALDPASPKPSNPESSRLLQQTLHALETADRRAAAESALRLPRDTEPLPRSDVGRVLDNAADRRTLVTRDCRGDETLEDAVIGTLLGDVALSRTLSRALTQLAAFATSGSVGTALGGVAAARHMLQYAIEMDAAVIAKLPRPCRRLWSTFESYQAGPDKGEPIAYGTVLSSDGAVQLAKLFMTRLEIGSAVTPLSQVAHVRLTPETEGKLGRWEVTLHQGDTHQLHTATLWESGEWAALMRRRLRQTRRLESALGSVGGDQRQRVVVELSEEPNQAPPMELQAESEGGSSGSGEVIEEASEDEQAADSDSARPRVFSLPDDTMHMCELEDSTRH